jgi:hypothetical protein
LGAVFTPLAATSRSASEDLIIVPATFFSDEEDAVGRTATLGDVLAAGAEAPAPFPLPLTTCIFAEFFPTVFTGDFVEVFEGVLPEEFPFDDFMTAKFFDLSWFFTVDLLDTTNFGPDGCLPGFFVFNVIPSNGMK